MNLKPTYKTGVILKKIEIEEESLSGNIIVPQSARQIKGNPLYEVISVGEDVEECMPGDKVIIEDMHQRDFDYNNDQYAQIYERNIFGKIKSKGE